MKSKRKEYRINYYREEKGTLYTGVISFEEIGPGDIGKT